MLKEEYAQSEVLQLEWKPQMDCAACVNGVWERGEVCSVSSPCAVEVLRCDFGSKVKLHPDKLRLLQPRLVGHLVLECSLAGIRPTGGCPTWTATACDFISDHLSGALAVINIKSCRRRPPVPVVLRCSSGPGQDVSFADLLVTRGLALKEELASSFPSEMPEEAVVQVENVQEAEEKPWKPVCCRYFPEKMKREPYPPPELPPRGRVQVTVTAVGDDGTIYAMTQQAERQCEQLKDGFQHHMKTFTRHKFYRWQRGMGCAVMGSDMTWYRGKVLEVIGEHVKVRYVDQGLVEEIPVCHVYPTVLREDVPELCVSCQLHGLIPIGGTWQPDAVTLLKELLHMRRLDILMMELPLEPWGDVTVQINLEGMNLSRIMVHHQHATADSAVAEEYVTVPSTARLDNWAIDHTGVKDPPLVPGKFRCSSLPDKGEHFRVQIKHLCTPNEVFLSVFSEPDNLNSEENLEEALRSVNEGEDRLFPLVDFAPERACLAKYSDGKYYRAKLLSIEGCNPVQILVRHVDYGSDDVVSTRRLRQMPLDLLKFPCEAIKVKVGGFRAPRGKLEQERILYQPEWSIKAMLEMISLLHGNITASVVSTESEITVFLYNERGVLVHHSLVEKGLADED
ncbi:RING finger protein 17 [Arapaima gigas]